MARSLSYPYESATEAQRQIGAWWWCVHHQALCEPLTEPIEARIAYIDAEKPEHERETRKRAIRPVLGAIPVALVNAWRAYVEARLAYVEAGRAKAEAGRAYVEAGRAYAEAWRASVEAWRAAEPALRALFAAECPDVEWDDDGLVFPKPEAPNV